MTHDATSLLKDVLQLPEHERIELAARLNAQSSSVISSDPEVMSGAPVFKGTRVLAQTLIEYLEAGDSIDEFLDWRLLRDFPEHNVKTVKQLGWEKLKDTALLRLAANEFDVFLTVDK